MQHTFLYIISLPSLHNYDVKMPNFKCYRGCNEARTKFFSLPELGDGS